MTWLWATAHEAIHYAELWVILSEDCDLLYPLSRIVKNLVLFLCCLVLCGVLSCDCLSCIVLWLSCLVLRSSCLLLCFSCCLALFCLRQWCLKAMLFHGKARYLSSFFPLFDKLCKKTLLYRERGMSGRFKNSFVWYLFTFSCSHAFSFVSVFVLWLLSYLCPISAILSLKQDQDQDQDQDRDQVTLTLTLSK